MKRVLIIDDEVDLCIMIKQFLTKKQYDVHIAHTLSQGFFCLNSLLPDSLILDNNLPDGMGWEVVAQIHEKYPAMKITLISAFKSAKDFQPIMGDIVQVLEKPVSMLEIERLL